MAKLEIPVVVNMGEIESLIDEIKHLQTYKLFPEDEQILINSDDVIKIFMNHVRVNIEPEPKKGHWIKIHWKAFRCSECNKISEYSTDFCPNCGADMRGESE